MMGFKVKKIKEGTQGNIFDAISSDFTGTLIQGKDRL